LHNAGFYIIIRYMLSNLAARRMMTGTRDYKSPCPIESPPPIVPKEKKWCKISAAVHLCRSRMNPMTPNSVIPEIKDRLDVVTVVGRYVPLKKSGSSYKGLCPFHSEKTPSFHVFPQTGTWKCFGCGAGGDIFTFVEKKENLPFSDVLRLLAKEAGVQLSEPKPELRDALQRLRDLHIQATSWFQGQLLTSPEGQRARDYLQRRGISQESIETFQLGYARDGWEHLIRHLKGLGFTLDEIVQGGLAIQREHGGAYDRFRGRLIIPIHDAQGRPIAFGGRILEQGEPKYLNSPQTPLFDKSQVIFALDKAKRAIRAKDQVVLVEGYMDVISVHQSGFKNVVAAMGTAITPQQIKLLSRYSRNFVFALDADAAGARATWRGVQTVQETLAERGLLTPTSRGFRTEKRILATVGIAIMPQGQDPDDVVREDAEAWRQLIANAIPVVDYTLRQTAQQVDLATAAGKSQFVQDVLPTLHKIGDAIQRRHYIGQVAAMAKVRESDVEEALKQFARHEKRRRSSPKPAHKPQPPGPETVPEDRIHLSSDEEPPLWLDDDLAATTTAPVTPGRPLRPTQQRKQAIGIEEHLLGLILLHHQELLPWLDDEAGKLAIDPLFVEDFTSILNRALFELLDDFRFDSPDGDLQGFMAEQDMHLYQQFELLWAYAQHFEAQKAKHIQFHHLQRDVITNLIRLRLERHRETQRQLEISLSTTSDSNELKELSQRFQRLMQERKKLEAALVTYSQSARWIKNHRKTYTS
jgi:DNA primase